MYRWEPVKMDLREEIYITELKIDYAKEMTVNKSDLKKSFKFAYNMADEFLHRPHRTGGKKYRTPNEIFSNAFQGKLAEYALAQYFNSHSIQTSDPDIELRERGEWDSGDLIVADYKGIEYEVSVKSTKHYGNLLLLECGDWDANGYYVPDKDKEPRQYNFIILVRLKIDFSKKLKSQYDLYNEKLDKKLLVDALHEMLKADDELLTFDIPGFINHSQLLKIIEANQMVHQGYFLNRKYGADGQKLKNNELDADNYYVQAGNSNSINELLPMFKND